MLPHDPPPRQTVYACFIAWKPDGTLKRVHGALRRTTGGIPSPARLL